MRSGTKQIHQKPNQSAGIPATKTGAVGYKDAKGIPAKVEDVNVQERKTDYHGAEPGD